MLEWALSSLCTTVPNRKGRFYNLLFFIGQKTNLTESRSKFAGGSYEYWTHGNAP